LGVGVGDRVGGLFWIGFYVGGWYCCVWLVGLILMVDPYLGFRDELGRFMKENVEY